MRQAWQCAALLCLALAAGVVQGECQTAAAAGAAAGAATCLCVHFTAVKSHRLPFARGRGARRARSSGWCH